jgi:hypothetical protein
MFMLRFVVQWLASERRKRSYVPVAFWYFSLVGGLMTLTYAYMRREPVFMLAQVLAITIYLRNLVLIYRRRWRYHQRRLAHKRATPAEANAGESHTAREPATPAANGDDSTSGPVTARANADAHG